MQPYSFLSLARHALTGHRDLAPAWRKGAPRPHYGSSLSAAAGTVATAYYLAKEHGIATSRCWKRGDRPRQYRAQHDDHPLQLPVGRQRAIYEHSLKLWEGLSAELNFNVMLSQRGVLNLAHNEADIREGKAAGQRQPSNGIDAEWLNAEAGQAVLPDPQRHRGDARYPVLGATLQRRGGVARHDAVAWGYARAADLRGVDIIENCEVTAIRTEGGRVVGVETSRGDIAAGKVAIFAAGHNSVVAAMAGVRLPLQSHPLQALVSEPVKPVLDCVVMSGTVHVYVSQSDKGELVMGAGIDAFNSYAQRGSFHVIEGQMAALWSCSRFSRASGCCAAGAVSSMSRRTPRRSSADCRSQGCTSTAAGAPAASRPPPAPAGSLRIRSRNDEPHPRPRLRARPLHDGRAGRRARRRRGVALTQP